MNRDGFFLLSDVVDIEKLKDEAAAFAEKFEENGVKVYWIEYPEKPIAAFGPMMNMHSAAELAIWPGGSIIPKKGYALAPTAGLGRAEYLARWAFWNLGIPPLITVTGTGVWVTGTFLADDVYCQGMGVETNWEGLDQVTPVLKRVCGEDIHVQAIRTPGWKYFDKYTGANTHGGMVISGLDIDKVLVHAGGRRYRHPCLAAQERLYRDRGRHRGADQPLGGGDRQSRPRARDDARPRREDHRRGAQGRRRGRADRLR